LQHVGSLPQLAERLRVSEAVLQIWLDGLAPAPLEVYLAALDLVANGPFGAGTKNKRPSE
jgi:hypothetical protein